MGSSILQNLTALASSQFLAIGIRFLYLLGIARMLAPDEVGIYLYGSALCLGAGSISLFGQGEFLIRRLGGHGGISLPVLHHSLTLALSSTFIVTAGLVLFVWASEPDPLVRLVLLCFVAAMLARVIVLWGRLVYIAIKHTTWIPRYEVIFHGTEALIGVGALYAGGGLLAIGLIYLLSWIMEAGFTLRKLAREYPDALGFGYRWGYLTKVTSVSLLFLISGAAMGLFSQIAIILLRHLQPDEAFVGHFGIATRLMFILVIIPASATEAFAPHLSYSFSRGDGGRDVIPIMKIIGLVALVTAIMTAAYAPWFIALVLGPEYAEASGLLRWLCWAVTPYAVVVFLCQGLNAIDRRREVVFITATMTLTHVVLLITFFEYQSPVIATIGSIIVATVGSMVAAMYQVSRQFRSLGNEWWLKFIFVMVATYMVFEISQLPLTITAPVALATGFLLIRLVNLFDHHDINAIRSLLGRKN
uniref:Membrane protein involved in the export of O-antigen and teichoic acid n=1 Tax=Candidatus Kentrum sp. MB TaxID=2138164 RepID=A0A451BA30_9GAMM|nr:MAG: Membrane protein involved in the export of O-antigen and teichoic acid [Candidatus Kentron sp. MB]VFK75135.1 MAG: Membrane protein involved in the export of O-antigen and teichoic acid [Candidatus Kentron sp. MB]